MKDKFACMCKFVQIISTLIGIWTNAKMVLVISDILEYPSNSISGLMILATLFVVQIVSYGVGAYLNRICDGHLYSTLIELYTDKILDADYKMFTDISCSKIITSQEQINRIVNCGNLLTSTITLSVNIIFTLVYMYLVGGMIIIPVILIYSISTIVFKLLFDKYNLLTKDNADKVYKRNQELDECINGFSEVRSFCSQEHHRSSIKGVNLSMFNTTKKRAKINLCIDSCFSGVNMAGTMTLLPLMINAIKNGTISTVQSYSVVMYLWRLVEPLVAIADIISDLSENLSMIEQFDDIMNYDNTSYDGHISLSSFHDSIKLRNVSFAYSDSNDVLNDISLTIKKGDKIGICGVSGEGKSTLIKLLLKFYDADYGYISIDGMNYDIFTNDSLRSKIAAVHQDNHIFNDTIYNNIVYGNWNCSQSDVIDAAKKANIYTFIQSLPDGLNTVVGPKGLKLSGGQKQRIALARVFLSNADIILLDEATSALDNETETLVQDALAALKDKTVITVAHRLSTIRDSDVIYVFNNHTVAEFGTHEELMKMKGVYASLNK